MSGKPVADSFFNLRIRLLTDWKPALSSALSLVFETIPAITFWILFCALLFDTNRVSEVAQYFVGQAGPARFVECVNKWGSFVLLPMTIFISAVRLALHMFRPAQSE